MLVPVEHAHLVLTESQVALDSLDVDELRRVPTFMSLPPESGYDEQFVGIIHGDRAMRNRSGGQNDAGGWAVDLLSPAAWKSKGGAARESR